MRADARVRGDEHEWRPTDGLISAKMYGRFWHELTVAALQ
jgi:hypothetical protein